MTRLKLGLGVVLRMPLAILAAKYIPSEEPGLLAAAIMFIIGDALLNSYYETRGASKSPISPSGPPPKN